MDQESESKPVVRKWLWIVLIVVVVLAAGYFGWLYYNQKKAEKAATVVNTVTNNPVATTTTPTPSAITANRTKTNTPTSTTTNTAPAASTPTSVSTSSMSSGGCPAGCYSPGTPNVKPKIMSTSTDEYADFDSSNGHIESIDIHFNTFMDASITSTVGFSVKGYNIASTGNWITTGGNSYTYPDSRAGLLAFQIPLIVSHSSLYDTGATPEVIYNASAGKFKNVAGVMLPSYDGKAQDGVPSEIVGAVAVNTKNQSGIQAGDEVVITFSEPADFYNTDNNSIIPLSASDINQIFALNVKNGQAQHGWLDGSGSIGSIVWSTDHKTLTITLSATGGVPTIMPGDKVTNNSKNDDDLGDSSKNSGYTDFTITGSF
jgi:hypothetical protein